MDKNDFAKQREKYAQELLRLYGKNPAPQMQKAEILPDDTTDETDEPDSLYPEAEISEIELLSEQETESEPEPKTDYVSEEILGTAKGFIEVNVRTGNQSEPVGGAYVEVSAVRDGKRLLIATAITDESGITRLFEVPAPETSFSQVPAPSERPYSLYDISVKADGFFSTRSVDVPVFEGITSVQTFSMIPVPIFSGAENETVTYYNQEPNS